jgi:hypothetical protein
MNYDPLQFHAVTTASATVGTSCATAQHPHSRMQETVVAYSCDVFTYIHTFSALKWQNITHYTAGKQFFFTRVHHSQTSPDTVFIYHAADTELLHDLSTYILKIAKFYNTKCLLIFVDYKDGYE